MSPLPPANVYGPYRYATAERFGHPQLVQNLEPVEAVLCPQPAGVSALRGPMPSNITQSEDCLQAVVYALPSPRKRWDSDPLHPVMVYLHGGSFLSGGGVLPWYDGRRLAAQGVVVVCINYRLGALGFLSYPPVGGDTLNGHRDIMSALEWVRQHASDFGGDPDRVTLFGQSAGALAVAGMYRDPDAKPYYRSAIIQSAPFPLVHNRTVGETNNIATRFVEALGAEPASAPVADILAAQATVYRDVLADTGKLAFFPLLPGAVQAHGPLIAGWNRDDATAFGFRGGGENETQATETIFAAPTRAFADDLRSAGCEVATYVFNLSPGPWGATHGAELPYIMGTEEAWADAPIRNETTWHDINDTGWPMRKAWTDFAKNADLGQVKSDGVWYLDWID